MIMTKKEYKQWLLDNDPGYFEMLKKDDEFYEELGIENPGRAILGEEEAKLYEEFLKITVLDDKVRNRKNGSQKHKKSSESIIKHLVESDGDFFYSDPKGFVDYISRGICEFETTKPSLKKWSDLKIKFFSVDDLDIIRGNNLRSIFNSSNIKGSISEEFPSIFLRKVESYSSDYIELVANVCGEYDARMKKIPVGISRGEVEKRIMDTIYSCLFGKKRRNMDYLILIGKYE